jgi:hypothetical protein
MRKTPSFYRKAAAAFDLRVEAKLLELGFVKSSSEPPGAVDALYSTYLETPVGRIFASPSGGWLYMKFENEILGRLATRSSSDPCNEFTGKWNFMLSDVADTGKAGDPEHRVFAWLRDVQTMQKPKHWLGNLPTSKREQIAAKLRKLWHDSEEKFRALEKKAAAIGTANTLPYVELLLARWCAAEFVRLIRQAGLPPHLAIKKSKKLLLARLASSSWKDAVDVDRTMNTAMTIKEQLRGGYERSKTCGSET